jgi:hypothetical protein
VTGYRIRVLANDDSVLAELAMPTQRRPVRQPGAGNPMYLACTCGGPLTYLGGDPGATVLRQKLWPTTEPAPLPQR